MLMILFWTFAIIFLLGFLLNRHMKGAKNTHNPELTGQTVIVTGGTSGIGRECVKQFCRLNAETVIFTGRNQEAASQLSKEMSQTGSKTMLIFQKVNFDDLTSVKQFAEYFLKNNRQLHILMNNAGALFEKLGYTKQGFEQTQGVNHIAVQYLTGLLLPVIQQTPNSRVVTLSSLGHERAGQEGLPNYSDFHFKMTPYTSKGWFAYRRSKTENVLFTKGLDIFFKQKGLQDNTFTVCLHPGAIMTDVGRDMQFNAVVKAVLTFIATLILKTPWEGAQTSLFCSLAPRDALVSGAYYDDCKIKEPYSGTKKLEEIQKLWNFTNREIQKTVGLQGYMFTDL